MRQFRSHNLGYLLFGLILFYLFFLWQFPYDGVKKAIVQNLEESLPAKVSIGRVKPAFPFHLHLENIRLESGPLFIQFPNMILEPEILDFFWGGENEFRITNDGNLGRFRGEYQMKKSRGSMKIRLNNLEIGTRFQKEFFFQTKVSGEAAFQWVGEDVDRGDGQAWILVERGKIQGGKNLQPPLPLSFIEKIRAEIQIQQGVPRVNRLEVNGKDLPGFNPGGGLPGLELLFEAPGQ
jgi:type II secretion system protein N